MSQKTQKQTDEAVTKEATFLSHLFELRDRLLRSVIVVVVIFAVLFPFSEEIYRAVASPLLNNLGDTGNMIAIGVAAPFLIPLKLVLVISIFIAVPYLLFQLWMFIAPALYTSEKKLALPLVFFSTVLFYTGAAFAHFVVLPLAFAFFTSITIEGVEATTDIAYYLDFVLTVYFAFGIAFEVPIATFLIVAVGMTTPDKLAKKRPYIVVGAFVIGMFLTPPDIISQTLLALPMWALFEIGLIFSRIFLKKKKEKEEADNTPPDDDPSPNKNKRAATSAGVVNTLVPEDPDYEILEFEEEPKTKNDNTVDDEDDYKPMTDEEMDAELDALDKDDDDNDNDNDLKDSPKKDTSNKKT